MDDNSMTDAEKALGHARNLHYDLNELYSALSAYRQIEKVFAGTEVARVAADEGDALEASLMASAKTLYPSTGGVASQMRPARPGFSFGVCFKEYPALMTIVVLLRVLSFFLLIGLALALMASGNGSTQLGNSGLPGAGFFESIIGTAGILWTMLCAFAGAQTINLLVRIELNCRSREVEFA